MPNTAETTRHGRYGMRNKYGDDLDRVNTRVHLPNIVFATVSKTSNIIAERLYACITSLGSAHYAESYLEVTCTR